LRLHRRYSPPAKLASRGSSETESKAEADRARTWNLKRISALIDTPSANVANIESLKIPLSIDIVDERMNERANLDRSARA
jgi:hypothetical protein